MSVWILDVLAKATAAVVATAFGLFVFAEAKALRIRKYLSDIEAMLDVLAREVASAPSQSSPESAFDHAKEDFADIENEMEVDVKRGLRLCPSLRREIKALREEINGLEKETFVNIVIKVLYDRPEGAAYISRIRSIQAHSAQLRQRIYFMKFLLP